MASGGGSSRGAVSVRRVLGVLSLLLGLFAMHGLAEHGTVHRTVPDASSRAPQLDAHAHPTASGQVVPAVEDRGPSDSHPDQDAGGLVGLCLAVLVVAIIVTTGSAGRSARGTSIGCAVTRLPTISPATVFRDRAPPDLLALSIHRC